MNSSFHGTNTQSFIEILEKLKSAKHNFAITLIILNYNYGKKTHTHTKLVKLFKNILTDVKNTLIWPRDSFILK